MIHRFWMLWFLPLTACASLAEKGRQLDLSDQDEANFKTVTAEVVSGTSDYSFLASSAKVEWIACKAQGTKATILVVHSDRAGYDKAKLCTHWLAQAFLNSGYDVLAINRPGYGASTGQPDFAGDQSEAAYAKALAEAPEKAKLPNQVTGAWGFETGASAAAKLAKNLKAGWRFLILGGGLYDYEQALKDTTDDYLKADLAQIKKTGGEKAIEDRSISYDTSGLPGEITIYHGSADTAAPAAQAKAFADSLESSGQYKVNVHMVEGAGHSLPWTQHRRLLEELLKPVP